MKVNTKKLALIADFYEFTMSNGYFAKNKKKKAEQQLKLKTAKYGAIAAWAIPALPIAETIRDVVKYLLLKNK